MNFYSKKAFDLGQNGFLGGKHVGLSLRIGIITFEERILRAM